VSRAKPTSAATVPAEAAAWAALSAGLIFLYAVFPYTYSHMDHIVPITGAAWHMWTGFSDFTHGMLVAPISLGLVYLKRRELARLPVAGSAWGLASLAVGLAFYLVGFLADVQYIGFFSVNFVVAGLILWFLGKEWMRAVAFPWLFLVFMWPMPFLDDIIAFPLRLIMSQSSHVVLSLLGIANSRVGTAVVSAADPAHGLREGARFAVDVADPCSGMHSLFALLMLSALYAYFSLERTWQKWVLFLMAIPLAILGNMVRIILLTFGTLLWGSAFAIGSLDQPTFFHMAAGYFVFAVAIGGMIGIGWLLNRLPGWLRPSSASAVPPPAAAGNPAPAPTRDW